MRLPAAAGIVLFCLFACRAGDAPPEPSIGGKEILLPASEAARLLEQAKLHLGEKTGPYAYMAEQVLREIVRRFPTSAEAAAAAALLAERGISVQPDKPETPAVPPAPPVNRPDAAPTGGDAPQPRRESGIPPRDARAQ